MNAIVTEKTQQNWIQYLFSAFIILLPLVYSSQAVDPVLIPRQTVLSFLLLVVSVGLFFGSSTLLLNMRLLPASVILLCFLYGVSIILAINTTESFYIAMKFILGGVFFLVIWIGFTHQWITIEKVAQAILLSSVLAVGLIWRDIILIQNTGIDLFDGENIYKVRATFGHKNLASAYLFLCLPIIGIQWAFAHHRGIKIGLAVLGLTLIATILLLQTRAVYLAFAVTFLLGGILYIFIIAKSKINKRILFIGLGIGFFLVITFLFFFRQQLALMGQSGSGLERINAWKNTWEMIQEHMLFGVGAGNWQIWFPNYGMEKFYATNYSISEGITNFQRPHNDFLWVWAETGIVGGILYMTIFFQAIWLAFQNARKAVTVKDQLIFSMLLLAFVGYVIIAMVDFPLERIEHQVIILTLLAFISQSSRKLGNFKWGALSWILVGIFCCWSLWVCYYRWQGERYTKMVHRAHATGQWLSLSNYATKAQNKYLNMDHFSIPLSWYEGVGYFMLNDYSHAKISFEKAYQLHPFQVHVLNNYATCFVKEGNNKKAIELLKEAYRISPKFSEGTLNLSGVYFNMSEYDSAYHYIKQLGFDGNNSRYTAFLGAILKAKIKMEQNTNGVNRKKLTELIQNDSLLLTEYAFSQKNNIEFMDSFGLPLKK